VITAWVTTSSDYRWQCGRYYLLLYWYL